MRLCCVCSLYVLENVKFTATLGVNAVVSVSFTAGSAGDF